MTRTTASKCLFVLNLLLAVALLLRLHNRSVGEPATVPTDSPLDMGSSPESTSPGGAASATANSSSTFSVVYSADPKTFAQNLRAIRCPEATIKDILYAEVHRRFKSQEEALRPTPADHVPYGWSADTTESRLVERREQAATMAREEAAKLREALGCMASVSMPQYAMTSSDQRFEETLSASPGVDACSIREVHDTYWADVHALLQRTKGFWLPQDVADLNSLKARHKLALSGFLPDL